MTEPTWERVLQDTSLDPAERVQALFAMAQWPEEVFHRFACDCAERALTQARQQGQEPDPACWQALAAKRRWLQGSITAEELQQAVTEARRAAHQASVLRTCYEAATAAADAASEVRYAARAAAWAAEANVRLAPPEAETSTRAQETAWQLNHLRQLLQELQS